MAKQVRVGNIHAIPLPDGRFAFCRVLKDASIGVYGAIADSKDVPPHPETQYLFAVPAFRDVLRSGEWPLIARVPFEKDDDAWPPPMMVRDIISGRYSIYHKGKMRPASAKECKGLERAAIWRKEQILDRIAKERHSGGRRQRRNR
jgi:Immunity protein 26